jgi:hypothetical protein
MSYWGWASKEALEKALKSEDEEIRLLAKRTWTEIHAHCDHAYGICSSS